MMNKQGLVKATISFKEIDALYDLTPGRVLTGNPEDPELVLQGFRSALDGFNYSVPYTNQKGEEVHGVDSELPGVYRSERVTGLAPFLRTFSRVQSKPIDAKYVYIYQADSKTGDRMRLLHELRFEGGQFGFVDLGNHMGQDDRPHTEVKLRQLVLPVAGLGAPTGPQYFFFLAPHQLAWPAVEELTTTVAHRGMRLFDEFWTDGYAGSDPEDAKDFLSLKRDGTDTGPLGFVMHLLDPIEEGLRRREVYGEALDRWYDEQARLAKIEKYVLATKVNAIAKSSPGLYEHVQKKLPGYLSQKEQTSFKLRWQAEMAAADLQRWIGERSKREALGFPNRAGGVISSDTWFSDGKNRVPSREDKGAGRWTSPFSNLVDAYRLYSPTETLEAVGEIVGIIHSRLSESGPGRVWVTKMFDLGEGGKLPEASGGLGYLFEAGRKGHAAVLEGSSYLLQEYAPQWSRKYRQNAIENLQNFMKAKYGIPLSVVKPASHRKYKKLLGKTRRRVKNRGLDHLHFDSRKTRGVKASGAAMTRIALGVELFNLYLSADAMAESPDAWNGLNLFGATLDAGLAINSVVKRLPEKAMVGGKAFKVCPAIAIVSGTIDTVLASRDWYYSTNFGQQAGNALRAVGSLLTVGGAAASETGYGILVAVVGLALQSAGTWVVKNFSTLGLFLQYSAWGEPGTMTEAATWISDKNKFYPGDLSNLAGDIAGQFQAIDELTYDYKPEFVLETPDSVMTGAALYVKSGFSNGMLSDRSEWTIEVDVRRADLNNVVIKSFQFRPDPHTDHINVTADQPILVLHLAPEMAKTRSTAQRAEGKILAAGRMVLDIDGDGKRLVTRKLDHESFRLSYGIEKGIRNLMSGT